MKCSLIVLYIISLIFHCVHSTNVNTGYTDAITLEEYEEDVELIKIRFDATRPCRFFCKLFYHSSNIF